MNDTGQIQQINRPHLIGTYTHKPAEIVPYDRKYPVVAKYLMDILKKEMDWVTIEHIGSTAVEGCDGKGVIDLMALYENGFLERTKDIIEKTGFQKQPHKEPFPEDRPLRVGSVDFKGQVYQIHIHIIKKDDDEAISTLKFRDILRSNKQVRDKYIECKKRILNSGVTDSLQYCKLKEKFVEQVIKGK